MPSGTAIALRYATFAAVATLFNLLVQRVVLAQGSWPQLYLAALACGTAAGLVLKYALDKTWIFYDTENGVVAHGRKLTLYTVAGIGTTAIFWGMESAFWLLTHDARMRELGAVLGLAIGYVIKYRLDKRFVFAARGRER